MAGGQALVAVPGRIGRIEHEAGVMTLQRYGLSLTWLLSRNHVRAADLLNTRDVIFDGIEASPIDIPAVMVFGNQGVRPFARMIVLLGTSYDASCCRCRSRSRPWRERHKQRHAELIERTPQRFDVVTVRAWFLPFCKSKYLAWGSASKYDVWKGGIKTRGLLGSTPGLQSGHNCDQLPRFCAEGRISG